MARYLYKDELDDVYYTRSRPGSERAIIREELDLMPSESKAQPKKVIRSIVRDQEENIEPIKRLSPNIWTGSGGGLQDK